MEAILSSKGRATIPKAVWEYRHLKQGDRFKFFLQPDGVVVLLPILPMSKLKGGLSRRRRPTSVEEMNAGVAAGATRRHLR